MASNQQSKYEVLDKISNGKHWYKATGQGQSKWYVGNNIIHVRYRSSPKADGWSYAYNINPNTLTSDFEVWICSNSDVYYLMPISVIKKIYYAPEAYVDYHHPDIRVVDINSQTHFALYGRGGKQMDFSSYFRAKL